jgi:hypothetical protein
MYKNKTLEDWQGNYQDTHKRENTDMLSPMHLTLMHSTFPAFLPIDTQLTWLNLATIAETCQHVV